MIVIGFGTNRIASNVALPLLKAPMCMSTFPRQGIPRHPLFRRDPIYGANVDQSPLPHVALPIFRTKYCGNLSRLDAVCSSKWRRAPAWC